MNTESERIRSRHNTKRKNTRHNKYTQKRIAADAVRNLGVPRKFWKRHRFTEKRKKAFISDMKPIIEFIHRRYLSEMEDSAGAEATKKTIKKKVEKSLDGLSTF